MLKNYSNNDKKIAIKLKKLLKNNYKPVENVDDTNLNSTQTDNQADFLALRIIDNLIRFNQSFRLSQVAIKANMGKYNKKGSGVTFVGGVFTKEELDDRGTNYKTEKPITNNGNTNKNYKKYGDVWLHHKAFDKLKSLIAKEEAEEVKGETNNVLQNLLDNVETKAAAEKRDENINVRFLWWPKDLSKYVPVSITWISDSDRHSGKSVEYSYYISAMASLESKFGLNPITGTKCLKKNPSYSFLCFKWIEC